jgi:PHD/YefM family antitoxin component YafN of YafNO toxin-antitoxin module
MLYNFFYACSMDAKIPAVLGVAEARTRLPELLAELAEDPEHAPIVVGAYRRPQGVLISPAEYERLMALDAADRLRRAEAAALAGVRAEGGEPSDEVRRDMKAVVDGEMDFDEVLRRTLARYRRDG